MAAPTSSTTGPSAPRPERPGGTTAQYRTPSPGADAARREHELAASESEHAAAERRAAAKAPTPWQQSAHLLAAEVFDDAAAAHERAAAMHEAQAVVEDRGERARCSD